MTLKKSMEDGARSHVLPRKVLVLTLFTVHVNVRRQLLEGIIVFQVLLGLGTLALIHLARLVSNVMDLK